MLLYNSSFCRGGHSPSAEKFHLIDYADVILHAKSPDDR